MDKLKKWASIFPVIASILPQILVNIPAIDVFNRILPPAYPQVAKLIGIGIGCLILIVIWFLKSPKKYKNRFPSQLKIAIIMFFISLFLIFTLLVSLEFTTTIYSGKRVQIGFYKYDWSLTKIGLDMKQENPDLKDWLYSSAGRPIYWKRDLMVLAGILNLILHLLAFCFWTACFAFVAKTLYEIEKEESR